MATDIYTVFYTAKSIAKAKSPISIAAGKKVCTAVGMPASGRLERLVVYQLSGTNVAFTVELFNSVIPFAAGEFAAAAAAGDTLHPYRVQMPVTAAVSGSSGGVATLTSDAGLSYHNIDGTFTEPQRYLYLLITPTSSGDTTTWSAFIQVSGTGKG